MKIEPAVLVLWDLGAWGWSLQNAHLRPHCVQALRISPTSENPSDSGSGLLNFGPWIRSRGCWDELMGNAESGSPHLFQGPIF